MKKFIWWNSYNDFVSGRLIFEQRNSKESSLGGAEKNLKENEEVIKQKARENLQELKDAVDRGSIYDSMKALQEGVSKEARRSFLRKNLSLFEKVNQILADEFNDSKMTTVREYKGLANQNAAFVKAISQLAGLERETVVLKENEKREEGETREDNGEREKKQKTGRESVSLRNELGFTPKEEKRLEGYCHYHREKHSIEIFNRSIKGRMEDHEIFMQDLLGKGKKQIPENYKEKIMPYPDSKLMFIDIGPGIANKDMPAITSQEMAKKFPEMQVMALDLPEEMDRFTGKDKKYQVSEQKRKQFLANPNIHVLRGDGLNSLKKQWEDPETNPNPERVRPTIDAQTTLIIRSANSMDIYCDWKAVKPAIAKIAQDFQAQPVVFFFNKEIMLKEANSTEFRIIGQVSDRGFNHNSQNLFRKGQPPYRLNPADEVLIAKND